MKIERYTFDFQGIFCLSFAGSDFWIGLIFIFDQTPLPINSYELVYTFQGLTADGKYYIAAVLPVTHLELPAVSRSAPSRPLS